MEQTDFNITLFRELVHCAHPIAFSEFDMQFQPLSCSSDFADKIFMLLSVDDFTQANGQTLRPDNYSSYTGSTCVPAICTNSIGLMWISEIEAKEGVPQKIHVMGPVFTDDSSASVIEKKLDRLRLSLPVKWAFLNFIDHLPTVPMIRMYEYALMLHRCLTGKNITISQLVHNAVKEERFDGLSFAENDVNSRDSYGIYSAEQALLNCVKNGNLQYKKEWSRAVSFGTAVTFPGEDGLQQAQTAVFTFNVLCCRAAISGGLSPETGYMLEKAYNYTILSSHTVDELTEVSHTLLEDYIRRVHCLHASDGISPQIRAVCDQITLHPENKLDIHALAEKLGYSDYYFSRKFKAETGMSIAEYDGRQKVEKAKLLLKNPGLRISEISDSLGFCSQSHFGVLFKRYTGISPTAFRTK